MRAISDRPSLDACSDYAEAGSERVEAGLQSREIGRGARQETDKKQTAWLTTILAEWIVRR
jgi:hypothetical protein